MSAAKPASKASSADREIADPDTGASLLERRITEYGRVGAPFAVILGAGIAGSLSGPPAAVLVLAGGALVAVIAVFWASLRLLLGETPLSGADAYALGAPRAEEEQKQAVLRALKDLEFERGVGKISDEDYNELVSKYRAEAKRLLRQLDADAQPRRDHVAALVAKRLRRAGLGGGEATDAAGALADNNDGAAADAATPVKRTAGARKPLASQGSDRELDDEDDAGDEDEDGEDDRETGRASGDGTAKGIACASCGTLNDEDAVFCKKCGTRRAPDSSKAPAEAKDADGEDQSGEVS